MCTPPQRAVQQSVREANAVSRMIYRVKRRADRQEGRGRWQNPQQRIAGIDLKNDRVERDDQRSHPGGTLARLASSSMSAISFLNCSISLVTRCSSARAFCRSSLTFAR